MNQKSIIGLALAGAIATSAAVMAAVTFDPAAGGFVGKGDVQLAFGWNNKQLQENASGVTFHYSDHVVVEEGPCVNPNTGVAHPNDVWERVTGLQGTVAYDARTRNQITGFILGAADGSPDVTYTDACGGNRLDGPGTIISSTPGDGLEVCYGGSCVGL